MEPTIVDGVYIHGEGADCWCNPTVTARYGADGDTIAHHAPADGSTHQITDSGFPAARTFPLRES